MLIKFEIREDRFRATESNVGIPVSSTQDGAPRPMRISTGVDSRSNSGTARFSSQNIYFHAVLAREGPSEPEAASPVLAESYRQAVFPATNTKRPYYRSTHGREAMSVADRHRNTFARRSRKNGSVRAYLSPSQAARRLPVAKRILRTWYGRRRDPSPAWARQTAERSHWLVSASIKANACTVNTDVRFFGFHSVYQG